MPLIEARSVERIYGRGESTTAALRGITLSVDKGEFLSIMGPSGSGKSTLIRCMAGIDSPSSGTVLFEGRSLSGATGSELARLRRERIAVVFQEADLIESLDVYDNLALPPALAGKRRREIDRLVRTQARRLGIESLLDRHPYQLSRGQRQMVAIARAFVNRPEIVFADEPTGALDTGNSGTVLEAFDELNRTCGTTVVMVTHDESAASWGRRVVFIRDGLVFAEVRRGSDSRRKFFSRIIGIVGMEGSAGGR